MVTVKTRKLNPDARLPERATEGSAGFDIFNIKEVRLMPNHTEQVPTGLSFEIPQGYELQIRPRSGLALRHGITVVNSPGTIDSDYRGEVCVLLRGPVGFDIPPFSRIAQVVVNKIPPVVFKECDDLTETERGAGGFGSTGT